MLLPKIKWLQLAMGGSAHRKRWGWHTHKANKQESSYPQNLWKQNLKAKTKPSKTHIINQHSNLCSLLWYDYVIVTLVLSKGLT